MKEAYILFLVSALGHKNQKWIQRYIRLTPKKKLPIHNSKAFKTLILQKISPKLKKRQHIVSK